MQPVEGAYAGRAELPARNGSGTGPPHRELEFWRQTCGLCRVQATYPVTLTPAQRTVPKEGTYFAVALVISIIVWLGLAISIIGLFYGALFALLAWLGNGLLVAHLRAEAVQVSERQLPRLHEAFLRACAALGVTTPPRLYVVQSGGALNAFATRFAGRDFVVVYSDFLEAFGPDSPEIAFILGHELGHVKSNHILKRLLLAPGLFFPLVGPAYLRACEASCDRHGAVASGDLDGAVRAMLALSGGKVQGPALDPAPFAEQHYAERGLFVSWHELTSGYPTFSQRVAQLLALRDEKYHAKAERNPFAYLFALFTPGGQMSAAPNMLVFLVVIGLLAAMAIPAFQKVRQNSMAMSCHNNARMLQSAYVQFQMSTGAAPTSTDQLVGPGKSLPRFPTCLAGGRYEFHPTYDGCSVTCSVHGSATAARQ